jgi:acyl carrier protein
MTVFETLKAIIVEVKDVDADRITMDANFADDLEADSLDVVEMLMLLEERLQVKIPEEASEEMRSVRDVVSYVEGELAK